MIKNLKFYLEQTWGRDACEKCFDGIKNIIYISLKACQSVMINETLLRSVWIRCIDRR